MPKISVISGFYNRATLLERTISSILTQTYDDIELIVFDDASTDNTADRLRALEAELSDPRLKIVINAKNRGFVPSLVDAIEVSTGDYIAIQGSGDASLPRRLELQAHILDTQPEIGVVGGWYYNIQENQGTERLRRPSADGMGYEEFLKGNVFSHGEVMFRRSAYTLAGGYRVEFKNAQDYDLWLRMSQVTRFATVPEPIYDRYVQFDGVSYVPRKIVNQSCYSVAARRLSSMSENDEEAALRSMRDEGPQSVVDSSDAAVQEKIRQAVLRLVVFGSPAAGAELARASITGTVQRWALLMFARLYGRRPFSLLQPVLRRKLGVVPRSEHRSLPADT